MIRQIFEIPAMLLAGAGLAHHTLAKTENIDSGHKDEGPA